MRSYIAVISVLLVVSCGDGQGLTVLGPLSEAKTTADETVVPTHARVTPSGSRPNPNRPDDLAQFEADGFGAYTMGPGESYVSVVTGGGAAPTPGSGAALITRFAHFADLQLADVQSPARVAQTDAPGQTSSASRAQDAYGCRMVAAMTRSLNAVHAETPLSFVLLGGDNTDNAQSNELDWVLALLGSDPSLVDCDSGADDEPGGPDPMDPFIAPGLSVPFVWVMGNHDVLNQGIFVVNDMRRNVVVGETATFGARDFTQPGGPVAIGPVVPDPARQYISRTDMLTRVSQHGDGHGVSATAASTGRATYAYDVAGTNIRFIILDTTSATGSAEGLLLDTDVNNTIIPLLNAAQAAGKWVMLASHHAASSLSDGGQFGGIAQTDYYTEAEWVDLITSYPNIVASFVGHSHRHRVRPLEGHGRTVWEIMTSALADFPHQSRLVEIFDEDNGSLRIRLTSVDFAVEDDPLAEQARAYGIIDFTSGWADDSTSLATDRNVDLYLPKPAP